MISFTGCSTGYIVQAAYKQSKILLARRTIEEVLIDPDTTPIERERLRLVKDVRGYAIEMGLDPGCSFTKYVKLDQKVLAWVLVASRRESFSLNTWWFPIVGTVPYKGFFELEDAQSEAKTLGEEGYESWIRGTEAFSTLGWFNDPILSTTLDNPPERIANTVIHESVHSTVWIPSNVPFNESLANFVGLQGAIQYFSKLDQQCQSGNGNQAQLNCELVEQYKRASVQEETRQYQLAEIIGDLYQRLEGIYNDASLTLEAKLAKREDVFNQATASFRAEYPTSKILQRINNAEIIQLKLYLSNLASFHQAYDRNGHRWDRFIDEMRSIAHDIEEGSNEDPFILLERRNRAS